MPNLLQINDDVLNSIGVYLIKLDEAGIVFSDQETAFQTILDNLWGSTAPEKDAMLDQSIVREMHDYFFQRADIVDGDYGIPEPNIAGRITHDLAAILFVGEM